MAKSQPRLYNSLESIIGLFRLMVLIDFIYFIFDDGIHMIMMADGPSVTAHHDINNIGG